MIQVRPNRYTKKTPDISMAPLIDMVFILLIFFLVTTSFTKETGVEVIKPTAATAQVIKQPDVLIAVTQAGTIHMEGRQIDLSILRSLVQQSLENRPKSNVIIIADENSRTGLVVNVMDECKLAGAKKVSLATRPEE